MKGMIMNQKSKKDQSIMDLHILLERGNAVLRLFTIHVKNVKKRTFVMNSNVLQNK